MPPEPRPLHELHTCPHHAVTHDASARRRLQKAVAGERAVSGATVSVRGESTGQPTFHGEECCQDPGVCAGRPRGCLPRPADPASSCVRYAHPHSPRPASPYCSVSSEAESHHPNGTQVWLRLHSFSRSSSHETRETRYPAPLPAYSGGWAGVAVLHLPVQNGDTGHTEGLVGVQQTLGKSPIRS